MITILPPPELITAITNLLNFFIAIAVLIYINLIAKCNKQRRCLWSITMGFIAVVGLLGAVVHGLALSNFMHETAWNVLGIVMGFMVTSLTIDCFYEKFGSTYIKKIIAINSIILLLYILAWIFISPIVPNNFYVFAVFAAISLITDFVCIISIKNKSKSIKWIAAGLLCIIVGSVFQAARLNFYIGFEVDTNSVYHIALSISLIFVALSFKCDKDE